MLLLWFLAVIGLAVLGAAVFLYFTLASWTGKPLPGVKDMSFPEYQAVMRKHGAKGDLMLHQQHGPVFTVAHTPFVSDPEAVKAILMVKANTEKRHPMYKTVTYLTSPAIYGVMHMDGEPWKKHTRALASAFHESNVLPYIGAMVTAVRVHSDARLASGGHGDDLVYTMRGVSADVVMAWAFGLNPTAERTQQLLAHMRELDALVADQTSVNRKGNPIWQLYEAWRLDRKQRPMVRDILQGLKDGEKGLGVEGGSGVNMILRLEEAGVPLFEISREVGHVYGAHKASGLVLAAGLYTLARHSPTRSTADSEWANIIREEAERVLQGRPIAGRSDVEALTSIHLVMNEVLRLHPVALVSLRWTAEAIQCGEVTIPAGPVVVSLHALLNDPGVWGEDAATFNPRRFEAKAPRNSFVPFLAGKRMCNGMPLARMEFAVMITTFLMHYDIVCMEDIELAGSGYTVFQRPVPFKVVRRS